MMSNTNTSSNFISSVKDGVKIIKFNRPKKKNAIAGEMYLELTKILNEDAHNDNIKVMVLTGVGDYYTSGNDLSSSVGGPNEDFDQMVETKTENVRKFVDAFIDYPKLLIAIVNGPAVGIGVTTLPLCDVVYASDRATFSTPFVTLGLCPEACSSYTFQNIMGKSKASEMLILGEKLTAEEAYRYGLVSKVFPHENLDQVFKDVMKYAELPPNSLKVAKKLMTRNKDMLHEINAAECNQLKESLYSEEVYEALAKFAARKSKL